MGSGYEVEPNLLNSAPAGRLWGPDNAASAEADRVAVEQRENAIALLDRNDLADFATQIVEGLAPTDVWQPYGATQGDGARILRMIELERGGTWKLAGVLAIGDAANTFDVLVTITDLVPGFAIRATAKRTDPSELSLNAPLRSLDGSFTLNVTGGAAADKVLVYLHLQRTGARLGGGKL